MTFKLATFTDHQNLIKQIARVFLAKYISCENTINGTGAVSSTGSERGRDTLQSDNNWNKWRESGCYTPHNVLEVNFYT